MCPTLQETESNHPESVGAICGYQYEKQSYQSRQFDNQYGKQPFWLGPSQWPYAAQRFGLALNVPQGQASYQQPSPQLIESASLRQLTISGRLNESVTNKKPGFQQNMNATIQDLKMQIGQLAKASTRFGNLPSQKNPNLRGNASAVTLRNGKELPQPRLQQLPRPIEADSKPNADSQMPQQDKTVPLPFPTRTLSTRKLEFDEELLRMFREIPKYGKFLKELCVHKRKKMKGGMEVGGIVSALTKNDEFTIGVQQALPKKYRNRRIFSIPCTIGNYTFADAMLDMGASINVMSTSIYKSLKFGDLEPTRMTIQLENRSVVQLVGVPKDVLIQVNELIFPTDFCLLDMEDETSGKGTTLILGRPFLMAASTKIDVHVGTLSMEFGDHLVQFNIFEAMKHPTEDHSPFGIDLIDELVEEHLQLNTNSDDTLDFAEDTDIFDYLGFVTVEADCNELREVHDLFDLEDGITDLADLVGPLDLKATNDNSSSPPLPMELKPLSSHFKYAYLDTEQKLPVIIAKNLRQEGGSPSNKETTKKVEPTILYVVKKEVTKLLVVGIIYLISDSQWVSPVQRVYIDYRRLNQETRKDHFPLPFIDQVLEKLARKSHYYFLDGFSGYMQIHIAPKDQHKTTFTCPFGTFAYTRKLFGLCNASSMF
ncbi:Retrovirus-related Pol polyprotein from transposon gypsy, partial [Mucuna pruriens]